MLWIGERTRQLDGAHVEYFSGVQQPDRCQARADCDRRDVVALCERLNPQRVPGRLTLICRTRRGPCDESLPPLLAAVREAEIPVVWVVRPDARQHVLRSLGSQDAPL